MDSQLFGYRGKNLLKDGLLHLKNCTNLLKNVHFQGKKVEKLHELFSMHTGFDELCSLLGSVVIIRLMIMTSIKCYC